MAGKWLDDRGVNNLTGEFVLPSNLPRPAAGNAAYEALLYLRDGDGQMVKPDADTVYLRLRKIDGTSVLLRLYSDAALTSLLVVSDSTDYPVGDGWYKHTVALGVARFDTFLKITSAGTEEAQYRLEGGWSKNGRHQQAVARFAVGDAADLDTIALDAATAAAGATAVGLGTDAPIAAGVLGTLQAHIRDAQEKLDALVAELGEAQGGGGTIAFDIADVLIAVGANFSLATDALAAALAAQTAVESGVFGNAVIKTAVDNVAALKHGARKTTFVDYFTHSTDLGSADPTDGNLALPTTQATDFTILAIKDLTIPEAAAGKITRVAYSVKWSGIVTNGGGAVTGSTRLEIAPAANVQIVGDVSTGVAISATQPETVALATRTISHFVDPALLPASNKVRVFLTGKVTDALDTLQVALFDLSTFEATFEVP